MWPTLAVVAVGATVMVAPIAVPWVVGTLGFGSEGIAGGTIASAFMATYGGAVPAGSVCAVLQSIGATGAIGGGAAMAAVGGVTTVVGAAGLAVGS